MRRRCGHGHGHHCCRPAGVMSVPSTPKEEWEYWDKKATELRRDQLGSVQASATKWSALMTAVLGVFGTVAFAGGLTTIDKLPDPWPVIAKLLTTAAAIAAVVAIVLLTLAAGGLSILKTSGFTPTVVRNKYTTNAREVLRWLRRGQLAAVIAGAFVLLGSAIVLWAGQSPPAKDPPTVVAVVDGTGICGQLSRSSDGALIVGTTPLKGVTNLTVVSACP